MWVILCGYRAPNERISGMKFSGCCYQSCFRSYIEMFIKEKRSAGFNYESKEWTLKRFDAFYM